MNYSNIILVTLWCTLFACTTEVPPITPDPEIEDGNTWDGPEILYSFKMNRTAAWGEPFVSGDFMMSDYYDDTATDRYYYFLRTKLSTGEILDSAAIGPYHVSTRAEHQTEDGLAIYASTDTIYQWDIESGEHLKNAVTNSARGYSSSMGQSYFTNRSSHGESSSLCLIDRYTLDTNSVISFNHPITSNTETFSSIEKTTIDGRVYYFGIFSYVAQDLSVPSTLFCYNETEKEIVWTKNYIPQVPNSNASNIGISNGILIARSSWRARGYHALTGEQIWEWNNDPTYSSALLCPFMFGNGVAYWCTDGSSNKGGTYGLDIETGELVYYEADPVGGAVLDIKKYKDFYVVLDAGSGAILRFDPETGEYSNRFESPNSGSFNQEFFNLSGFSIDESTGRLAINDTENIYVFDISDW